MLLVTFLILIKRIKWEVLMVSARKFINIFDNYNKLLVMSSNSSNERPSKHPAKQKHKSRQSFSPTQTSHSDSGILTKSYKNQPIPNELRKKIISKKYQLDDLDDNSSSQEGEVMAVLQEQQQQQIQQKPKLPKLKVMSDSDQFSETKKKKSSGDKRCRINTQQTHERGHSAAPYKLDQVLEEKKQDEDQKNNGLPKLVQFKDNNQFGRASKCSSKQSQKGFSKDALEGGSGCYHLGELPEKITENPAQETKIQKQIEKSILTQEIEKLIVDEVDELTKKRNKEDLSEETINVIEEEKGEQQIDTSQLSKLLMKFEHQSRRISNIKDQQVCSRQVKPESDL